MRLIAVLFAVLMLASGCDGKPSPNPKRAVALGDSLMAGYGLQPGESYPDQLQEALRKKGWNVAIDNAGVSGNTTSDGFARLDQAIAGDVKPDLVIVALGANDMLRSVPPAQARENLRKILQYLKDRKISTVLYGMKASGFASMIYRAAYSDIYSDLADEFDVAFYPFFLKGVALNPQFNLGDNIHPNKQGVAVMVENTEALVADALAD